jgi:hypothetical protein
MRRQYGWPLQLMFGTLRLGTTSFWAKAMKRREAREQVEQEILQVLAKWEGDLNSGA